MPNHVMNTLVVTGDNYDLHRFVQTFVRIGPKHPPIESTIDPFLKQIKNGGGYGLHLDLEAIVPQPDAIKRSFTGTAVILADMILHQPDRGLPCGGVPGIWGVATAEQATGKINELAPWAWDAARANQEAKETTGHADWRTWRNAHWGTNWNSYGGALTWTGMNRIVLTFQTTWTAPLAALKALAEDPRTEGLGLSHSAEGGHPRLERVA